MSYSSIDLYFIHIVKLLKIFLEIIRLYLIYFYYIDYHKYNSERQLLFDTIKLMLFIKSLLHN